MNTFLNELKNETNIGRTENGAIKRKSTLNAVLDMFALGGAFRYRSDDECIDLFGKAFDEDPELALKCLFYLRDCRFGQGERRFFRICFQWLANFYPDAAKRNLPYIAEYGRFDDVFYSCINTPLENDAYNLIKKQLVEDVQTTTPSLLGKWLPSENCSSAETKAIANKIRSYLGMTHKQYRKTLSILRSRINVLEKLMSEGKWDEIQFDSIPSKAGINYRNAFATREETKDRYKAFLNSKDVKVNASVLTPVDVVHKAMNCRNNMIERKALDQYWKDLPDYYGDTVENGLAIVDVSGSMWGLPMEAAIGLGAYIAERGHGPFVNHFITFSQHPQLVKFYGADIVEKVNNCQSADWGYNTNIEAVFDILLRTAKSENTKPEDMPTRLYILSDMEFDYGLDLRRNGENIDTLLESIAKIWRAEGYELPQVVFWNLNARSNNIPAIGGRFSYVSGFSPVMIPQILGHVSAEEIMKEKLLSDRYSPIK